MHALPVFSAESVNLAIYGTADCPAADIWPEAASVYIAIIK